MKVCIKISIKDIKIKVSVKTDAKISEIDINVF